MNVKKIENVKEIHAYSDVIILDKKAIPVMDRRYDIKTENGDSNFAFVDGVFQFIGSFKEPTYCTIDEDKKSILIICKKKLGRVA